MSIFTEVRGKTSDTFLLYQMQKELKCQAFKISPTQGMKSIPSFLQMLLHPKKANFQLNAALWCAVYLQGFSLDPELLQQKTLGSFILPAEQYTVRPPYRSIWKLSPHHWTQTMFLHLQPYMHPNNGNERRLCQNNHKIACKQGVSHNNLAEQRDWFLNASLHGSVNA